MRKKTDNGITTFLSSLLIMMFVVMVVGFLFFQTDNFTTTPKAFYVKNGGNTFVGDYANFNVIVGKEYKFDIVNTIDNIVGSESKYTLSIIPNNDLESTNFEFEVDGVLHNYHDLDSLSVGFNIFTNNDNFIIKATQDLPSILQNKYWGQTLTNVPTTIDSRLPYYRLVISSIGDEVVNININFNLRSE